MNNALDIRDYLLSGHGNTEEKYVPSHFLALFCPRKSNCDDEIAFADKAGAKPNISVDAGSFTIYLAHSISTRVAIDREERITLILHGEIYDTDGDQAKYLIDQYIKQGISSMANVNGSFVILLIHQKIDSVWLVTDRLNSKKVFCSKNRDNYWLSTSLYLHPTEKCGIDATGLACYLANGVIHNNRTLFDGIRTLERACIHRLTEHGFAATKYWSYEFCRCDHQSDRRELRDELSHLIIDSVRARVGDNENVILSLSGGYDSTGVLGILATKLGISGVQCFSYAFGEPKPRCDAYVAREMANHLGYDHRVIQSYCGDLLKIINYNASLGQGLANFCYEIDAWMKIRSEFSNQARSALLVGDECFGWTDCELQCDIDVLNSVSIHSFEVLSWLSAILPERTYIMLYDGLEEELVDIIKRCLLTGDYHDSKDFLYLDQRLSNHILPWREFFAGQFVNVRNPFLDNSILDFMMKVPSFLRRGKVLYRETITSMFPELFSFARALYSGHETDWRRQFSVQQSSVESLILTTESKLDKIIPADVVLRLLKDMKNTRHGIPLPVVVARKIASKLLNRAYLVDRIADRFLRKKVDVVTFLIRILVARSFLSSNGRKSILM